MTRRRPRLTPPDTPFPYTTLFLSRLNTVNISQASADQRAGRAGRVAEGWCYRLWLASRRLEPARTPEIAQLDLAPLALELAAWGSAALRFSDPPPVGALAAGRALLHRQIGRASGRGRGGQDG